MNPTNQLSGATQKSFQRLTTGSLRVRRASKLARSHELWCLPSFRLLLPSSLINLCAPSNPHALTETLRPATRRSGVKTVHFAILRYYYHRKFASRTVLCSFQASSSHLFPPPPSFVRQNPLLVGIDGFSSFKWGYVVIQGSFIGSDIDYPGACYLSPLLGHHARFLWPRNPQLSGRRSRRMKILSKPGFFSGS